MKRIYLVGFMGCGKSAIGKRLHTLTDIPFYDMDHEISEQMQLTIPEIFEKHGEPYFRQLETEFLRSFPEEYCIVATGGGVAVKEENIQLMRETGIVFFLNASFRDIWRRISTDVNRPIVQQSSRKELETLYRKRKPKYIQACHFTVETSGKSLTDIAEYIIFQIERYQ
ncbi:shikimate kinase [Sporosarcina sp. P13]|uniref:shikimate kinase n=1 Tax=Sporosarcina sp. P13 TaxID=2048263 RepID=UPI000C166C18|nr:shikimate kinase [Sporosarcina sp. P13]PIC65310.1 shikimate kinase [Sporosarcina sp. P13]